MAAAEAKQRQLDKLKRVLDSLAKRDAQVRGTEGLALKVSSFDLNGSASLDRNPHLLQRACCGV
eukprot:1138474-Pelagomonas_calceolata.AAC.9